MTLAINSRFPLQCSTAYDDLCLSAHFRSRPEDFYVEEILGAPLSGEGEHLCLYIEKQGHNTHWVAAELARYAGIGERDIGVCGRKDRHAITRQWFSLYDPSRKDIDWNQFDMEGAKIIQVTRHHKKLRLGSHEANRFVIRLRQVVSTAHSPPQPLSDVAKEEVTTAVLQRVSQGVPNYFGIQRFGREGGNLQLASDWLERKISPPRKQRSMVLSAARSYLFNRVLTERVSSQQWQAIMDGDIVSAYHPTGPLWGRGRLAVEGAALALEQAVLLPFATWCERLEHQGLKQERRALVLQPKNASCFWQNDDLIVSFDLPSGTFATAVLAEITVLENQVNSTL
jgi:tRNA pseudouridine13 synthase